MWGSLKMEKEMGRECGDLVRNNSKMSMKGNTLMIRKMGMEDIVGAME